MDEIDVLVVGGGPAGVTAATEAARSGCRTMLVEAGSCCGGAISRNGIFNAAYFRAKGRQIVGGIGWELAQECVALSDGKMPGLEEHTPNRPGAPVVLPGMVFAMLAEEKFLAAGGELAYGLIPLQVKFDGKRWLTDLAGKLCQRRIAATQVVDCTGDASIVRMAGGACMRSEPRQPGTLTFHLTGYDPEKLDAEALELAYREALACHELQPGDFCFEDKPFVEYLRRRGGNCQHIFNADSSDAITQSDADVQGRQRLLKMLRFLRRQPGLEHCVLQDCCETTGIRESWRIVGRHCITAEEYLSGKQYEDAVALTYYYIDIHHERGIEYQFLRDGVFPEIPLGALLPEQLPNLLCAGKALCCDERAFSALRVEASCMAMGQAAGAAAAQAVSEGVSPDRIALDRLRQTLKSHGAVLPDRFN